MIYNSLCAMGGELHWCPYRRQNLYIVKSGYGKRLETFTSNKKKDQSLILIPRMIYLEKFPTT